MTVGSKYNTELAVCVDCAYLLANGAPESVEPSWCPDPDGAIYPADYPRALTEWYREHGTADYWPNHYGSKCDGACPAAIASHSAAVESAWPDHDITLGSIECEHCGLVAWENGNQEDCEPWFSHSGCDLCGSPLGGSRSHAVATPKTLAAAGLSEADALRALLAHDRADILADAAYDKLLEAAETDNAALRDLLHAMETYFSGPRDDLADLDNAALAARDALGETEARLGLDPTPAELAAYAYAN